MKYTVHCNTVTASLLPSSQKLVITWMYFRHLRYMSVLRIITPVYIIMQNRETYSLLWQVDRMVAPFKRFHTSRERRLLASSCPCFFPPPVLLPCKNSALTERIPVIFYIEDLTKNGAEESNLIKIGQK
jgi:hypothetical protein